MIKGLNYKLSAFLPQKVYWYLAGLIHPWQAVLEDTSSAKEVYSRGSDFVVLLEKFKLINKKTKVLDIGCGVGRVEYALAKKVENIVGIDISPSMIRLANANVKAKNVEFLVGNGQNLQNLADSSFDLVFSVIVFQHLPRKTFKNYLKESYRVLGKGNLFFQISVDEKGIKEDPPKNHPWALRYYKTSEIKKILEEIGFKNIKFFNIEGKKLAKNSTQALVLATKL
jgi:ubiquinone/menaquinone biosynthesis C-methylase UbiE